ncbi:MAG: peptide chain release factor 1 [Phycisphaerae bacterium]|nr:peptide chain release factor 1 [Phycisphaerae bacterium]
MGEDVDSRFIRKLQEISDHYHSLVERMGDVSVAANPIKSLEIAREMGRLKRLVEPFDGFRKVWRHLEEARSLSTDTTQDADLRELAMEEVAELGSEYARRLESLKEAMVTNEDAVISSVLLEIRAGTGGDEAALFARDLYEMYLRFCEKKGFKVEVLDQSGSDIGGLKEVTLSIKGEGVYLCLGYEGGGHRVQRVPETEAQGRIHTSAATVAVLPEPEEINIDINWDTEVEEFVSRAGGPGGQNVNKVSSAIRLVHHESGITVSMRDEKSQHKNRAKARRVLLTRLYEQRRRQQQQARDAVRKTMIGSGDRSQRIRTYNFPQNRCTDHRIGMTMHCLDRIIQGELDELIAALQTYDKEQRLKNI